MADDGLITVPSTHAFDETLSRLDAALKAKNLTLFTRIDHAAGAAQVGLDLRPTTVVIFGNPRGGTPLMQSNQAIGLDLPLKMLVWQDGSGKVSITYNDPAWLASRYGIDSSLGPVSAISAVMRDLAKQSGQ